MDSASKLFEKYNRKINRQTQTKAWTDIITKLADSEIFVPDHAYLRKRISNWIQRSTVLDLNFFCFG